MITGFNTDIEYEGVTYHVQTEDKGTAKPLILTLVYDRGTILASKRSPYDDLLNDDFDENILIERLKKQHKLICGAVRAGRLEDLKRMSMKESDARRRGLVAQKEIKPSPARVEDAPIPMPTLLEAKPPVFVQPPTEEIVPDNAVWNVPLKIVEEPAADLVETVEEIILPAEAVEIVTDLAKTGTVDDKLKIDLLGDVKFKGGERKTINLLVWRGNRANGMSGAQILVKVIGASFRPLIFHAKTDGTGIATVHLQLPYFKAGRAAVLMRVMNGGEEVELRRIVRQN